MMVPEDTEYARDPETESALPASIAEEAAGEEVSNSLAAEDPPEEDANDDVAAVMATEAMPAVSTLAAAVDCPVVEDSRLETSDTVPLLSEVPTDSSSTAAAALEEREKRALAAERRRSGITSASAESCQSPAEISVGAVVSGGMPGIGPITADAAASLSADRSNHASDREAPTETAMTPDMKLPVAIASAQIPASSSSCPSPNSCEPLLRINSEKTDEDKLMIGVDDEDPPPPPGLPPTRSIPARYASVGGLAVQAPVFKRVRMRPVSRDEAGECRLQVRDAWNVQELRIEDLIDRYADETSNYVDEACFRDFLRDFQGCEPDEHEFKWLMSLADQDKDGLLEHNELQYGLRAHYGFQRLEGDYLRKFAEYDFNHSPDIDKAALLKLLTDLNGGLRPEEVEVDMVLGEASAVGNGSVGRPELLRGIGAWYGHVARRNTSCAVLLNAGVWRFLPEKEHHAQVLSCIAWVAPLVSEALQSFRGTSQLREDPIALVAGLCQMLLGIVILFLCCLALLFPTSFFSWMVYFGSTRGSDLCPKDLDGLLVWCGAVGLATLVVSCVSPASRGDRSYVRFALKAILMVMPWTGVKWTYQLTRVDRSACDPMMYWVSVWVWSLLAVLEVMLLTAVCFGIGAVFVQEQKLRARCKHERLDIHT